ncbi:hypothetical protein Q4Q35_05800 [Flavivirga aquimarina]|uniref:Secreted protein n=1 Tax=Flavivirga aquimarina TaxID=2027862 RepID=A0ABT8W858_9FLAO|nr:hypothetical protein [Flavivirga aquimarina]MDO5969314.1 hypothetical protein [Flavivirga aquimarina]
MKSLYFILLMFFMTAGIMSCSTDDDLTETPTYATGGEIDDPVEPDRD